MKIIALPEVATIIMGQSPPSTSYNSHGEGLPFFQGKTDFGDLYPQVRLYCSTPNKISEPGDILISVRAPVGPTNLAQVKSCIGRGLAAIRASDCVDSRYLLYFLRHHEPQLARLGTGSTFEAISREDLENIKLPWRSLPEQQRIAAILTKADRLRRYALELGESYLQSVFLEMFGDPLTNPCSWPVSKLSSTFRAKPQIGTPTPAHEGGNYLVVRVGEIGDYEVVLDRCARVTLSGQELQKFKLEPDDLLLARAIGSEEHLGKASILQHTRDLIVYDSPVMRLRFDPALLEPQVFLHWLQSKGGRARFMRKAGRTALEQSRSVAEELERA